MPGHPPGTEIHRTSPSRRRRWLLVVAGGVVVALLAVGGGVYWARHTASVTSTASACRTATPAAPPTPTAPAATAPVSGTAVDQSTTASRDALRQMGGVGFSQGYQPMTLGSAKLTRLFHGIAGTGATFVRLDLNWSDIEPSGASSYDITHTLDVYRAASAQGLSVLPVVTGVPAWASSAPGGCGAAFAAFMTRASPALIGAGIRAVELGNEMNITGMSPQAYTDDVLVPGSRAFRAAGIRAGVTVAVISAGLAPATTGRGSWSPTDFLRGVYAAGGGPYLDAVGMHPYSWPAGPDSTVSWNWLKGSTEVRAVMVANGDADKTMWATEYGFPTNSDRGVTDAQQAAYLRTGAAVWSAHSWAGALVLYSYEDLDTGTSDPEDNFGVRDSDGAAKPSYDVVKALASDAAQQYRG